MLAVERRNMILEKLQDERKVVVSELSTLFDVSEETIRRDLDKLDRQGLAIKSYGGAVLNENSTLDMPFNVRKNRNIKGKQQIAELISGLVKEDEHIIVDPSICTGGTLRENYLTLVGSRAADMISSFYADKAIISCKGIDMNKGVTDANEALSQVKQAMLRSAKQRIVAADHTKFGNVAFSRICELSAVDMVVTDVCPGREWMDYFGEKGIECIYGREES